MDSIKLRRLAGIPVDLSVVENAKATVRTPAKLLSEAAKVPQHRGELAPKTKDNMRARVNHAKKALEALETAREELMNLPAVDYMEDVPTLIKQLHHMLHGEDGTGGVHHLHRHYKHEFDQTVFPEDIEDAKQKEQEEADAAASGADETNESFNLAAVEKKAKNPAPSEEGKSDDLGFEKEEAGPSVEKKNVRKFKLADGSDEVKDTMYVAGEEDVTKDPRERTPTPPVVQEDIDPRVKKAAHDEDIARKELKKNPFTITQVEQDEETVDPVNVAAALDAGARSTGVERYSRPAHEVAIEMIENNPMFARANPQALIAAVKQWQSQHVSPKQQVSPFDQLKKAATDLNIPGKELAKNPFEQEEDSEGKDDQVGQTPDGTYHMVKRRDGTMTKVFVPVKDSEECEMTMTAPVSEASGGPLFARDAEHPKHGSEAQYPSWGDAGRPANVVSSEDGPSLYYPWGSKSENASQLATNPYNENQAVKVPAKLTSSLKAEADVARKLAETFTMRKDWDNKNFHENLANAFDTLNGFLDKGTIYGIKEAQVFMTSLMSPIMNKIPADVIKFVASGGSVRSLKSYMNDVKQPVTGVVFQQDSSGVK